MFTYYLLYVGQIICQLKQNSATFVEQQSQLTWIVN